MTNNADKKLQDGAAGSLLTLLRPRQWVKNAFVAAPLIFTGLFLDPVALGDTLGAVVLFCLTASIVYIFNDIRDLPMDRLHPRKSLTRPLAAGAVSVAAAQRVLALLCVVVAASYFWMPGVAAVLGGYIALNLAYTYRLKHEPVLDIFCIATGFVLRVYAGALAIDVPVSGWMFITTLSLALYLAAVKRRQELSQVGSEGRAVLKKYSVKLVDRYAEMSATGALVFYSLFVMAERPQMVMTVPVVLFGIFRYWYVVEEYEAGESPTDALLADYQLLAAVSLWIGLSMWAMWPHHA